MRDIDLGQVIWQIILSPWAWIAFLVFGLIAVVIWFFLREMFREEAQFPEQNPPDPLHQLQVEIMIEVLTIGSWEIIDIVGYYSDFKWQLNHKGTSLKISCPDWTHEIFFPNEHPQEKSISRFLVGERVKFTRNSLPSPKEGEHYPSTYLTVSID